VNSSKTPSRKDRRLESPTQVQQQDNEGEEGGATSHGVKPAPPLEQRGGLRGRRVEARVEQSLGAGEDDDERERDHGSEQQARQENGRSATLDPRTQSREEADESEAGLHHGGAAIAGTKLVDRSGRAASQASGMLDEGDVDSGAREQAGAQSGDELEQHLWTSLD
jgi:hypothetical protein